MDLWFSEAHSPDVKLSIRVDRQLYSAQSEFQRIDVFHSPEFGRFLTLDGYMMLTEKDEFIYHEMITHPAMAVHPRVRDVLVIGAGDGGVIRELCRYDDIEHIDMVEIDPQVVEVCREYLPKTSCSLDDPRVSIHYEDGLKFICLSFIQPFRCAPGSREFQNPESLPQLFISFPGLLVSPGPFVVSLCPICQKNGQNSVRFLQC